MSKVLIDESTISHAISDFGSIKEAANIPDGTPTSEYANKIKDMTPQQVYAAYRPPEWLPMPDVSENEIYLLFHLSPPAENFIAFTVTCTGSYTVEWGTVVDNEFVPAGSTTLAGGRYEGTFHYDDWGDEISFSFKQIMLRITGNILTFEPAVHSARNYSSYRNWNIVEFKGNLPDCTSCIVGGSAVINALQKLVFFSLEGTNKIYQGSNMFRYCYSLLAVLELDLSNAGSIAYLHAYNNALAATPVYNTSACSNVNYMYYHCYSLRFIQLDMSNAGASSNLLTNNYSLTRLIFLNGNKPNYTNSILLTGSSITAGAVKEFFNSLSEITASQTIDLTSTPAAYEFSQNSDLANTTIAIASERGWTVSY